MTAIFAVACLVYPVFFVVLGIGLLNETVYRWPVRLLGLLCLGGAIGLFIAWAHFLVAATS